MADLCKAAYRGDERRVLRLLSEHDGDAAYPNSKDKAGSSALHLACESGETAVVSALLTARADVDARDATGRTALFLAVPFPAAVRELLGSGADVDVADKEGWTPLHLAAASGTTASVEQLLAAPGSVPRRLAAEGPDKKSVLCRAVGEGRVEATELLLRAGADPNAADADGDTPLHHAVNQEEALQLLDVLFRATDATDTLDINAGNNDGDTPLHYCANTCDDMETWPTLPATALIRHGADPARRNSDGMTAQDMAQLVVVASGDDMSMGLPSPARPLGQRPTVPVGMPLTSPGRSGGQRAGAGALDFDDVPSRNSGAAKGSATKASQPVSPPPVPARTAPVSKARQRKAKRKNRNKKHAKAAAATARENQFEKDLQDFNEHVEEGLKRDTDKPSIWSILAALLVVLLFFLGLRSLSQRSE